MFCSFQSILPPWLNLFLSSLFFCMLLSVEFVFLDLIFGLLTPGERAMDVTGTKLTALNVRAVVGRYLTNKLLTVVVSIVKTGTGAEKEYQTEVSIAWRGRNEWVCKGEHGGFFVYYK